MSFFHSIREVVRKRIPPDARARLRVPVTYGERLWWWSHVLREIRGRTNRDKMLLAVSAAAAPLTATRDLLHWKDPELLHEIEVLVRDTSVFRLRPHTDDLFHVLPRREFEVIEAVLGTLSPGDVFVDAGANIGFYTVLASQQVGASGSVIAVEMMPDTAARLREHVAMNSLGNVTVINAALASRHGMELTASVPEGRFGQAKLEPHVDPSGKHRVRVVSETLDRILANVPHVRLMKMDIEGAEAEALRGATDALRKIDAIVFEDWSSARGVKSEPLALLEAAGFDVKPLGPKDFLATRRAHQIR